MGTFQFATSHRLGIRLGAGIPNIGCVFRHQNPKNGANAARSSPSSRSHIPHLLQLHESLSEESQCPFVSPRTRVCSCLAPGLVDGPNNILIILAWCALPGFPSTFSPNTHFDWKWTTFHADTLRCILVRCKRSREDAGASTRFPNARHLLRVYSTEVRRWNHGVLL